MLYFIQGDISKNIKIGITNIDVENRMYHLQSSDMLTCLKIVPHWSSEEERVLHKRFAHIRSHGEWFKPDNDLINFIESLPEPFVYIKQKTKLRIVRRGFRQGSTEAYRVGPGRSLADASVLSGSDGIVTVL